jgi:hypothetical protein
MLTAKAMAASKHPISVSRFAPSISFISFVLLFAVSPLQNIFPGRRSS